MPRPRRASAAPTPRSLGWQSNAFVLGSVLLFLLSSGGSLPGPSQGGSAFPPLAVAHLPSARIVTSGTPSGSAYNWFDETPSTGPGPRELPAFAYDPFDGYTLFFAGGQHRNVVSYSDTWTYRAGVWTKLSTSPSPPGRLGAGLVYDATDGYMLLFGGYNETLGFLNDTWAFTGGHWISISPPTSPSPRWIFGMDYDVSLSEVVLFGGGNFAPLGETWAFRGGIWTLEAPTSPSPPWRSDTSMSYDAADGVVVLYGGYANGTTLGDTWQYSARGWTPLAPSPNPPGRSDVGLAYDPLIPAVVLTTWGSNGTSAPPVTWAYSSGTWKNLSGTMRSYFPTRAYQVCTWDGADRYLLMFGGLSFGTGAYLQDTWALDYLNASAALPNLTGEVPFRVNLTASYSGGIPPLRFNWSLSGAGRIATANASFPISSEGSYPLTFVVTDRAGDTVMLGPFGVTAIPAVSLVVSSAPSARGVAPLRLNFTATATGGSPPYSYRWDWGDGGTDAGSPASHRFNSTGTFQVNATVGDGYHRTASSTIDIVVSPPHVCCAPRPNQTTPAAQTLPFPIVWVGLATGIVAVALVGIWLWRRRAGRPPPEDASAAPAR
ncbi:MAG TPA: PKD domain-containing protein [Thermoplasmata archaeon]|nr:PKD domain-containing protein [Thermoplasmata archaeon]